MNQGPTSGFEEDVGSRTTHHVMYPESAIDLENNTCLVLVPFKTLDLQWIISALTTGTIKHTYTAVTSRIKANKDKVNVFGFGADQYGNWHHYWEENHLAGAFRHTGVHDGDYEYNVTMLLADKHKIQMFHGR
ncbi:hypothetical protein KUCAC02_019268, partial [Chaenocephalus aceratus]